MIELFESTEFILLLIFGTYLFGQWVFKKTKFALFHPLIISIGIIIAFLQITGIDYATFQYGSRFVHFLLGPSVVALGYVLYEQIGYLKGNMASIFTAISIGSIVGIVSVIILAQITGADQTLIYTLEPKSVTTPIAMSISEQSGGDVTLTAIVVVFCGIYGSIVGPPILRWMGIKSPVAKGIAMGASSHGVGTARAMEMGTVEGALSGLAIGLMGIITSLFIPIIHLIIDKFF